MMKNCCFWKAIRDKLSRYLGKQSFRNMIYLVFTLTAVIEIGLLSGFYMSRYNSHYESMMRQKQEEKLETAVENVDQYIRLLNSMVDSVYFNILRDNSADMDQKRILLNYAFRSNSNYITDISCFDIDGKLTLASPDKKLRRGVNVKEEKWFKEAAANVENTCFSDPVAENIFEDDSGDYEWVIPVSRYININAGKSHYEGVILINLKFNTLSSVCKYFSDSTSDYVYLVNSKGEIIAHPYMQRLKEGFMGENYHDLSDGIYKHPVTGYIGYYGIKTVGYTGWRLVNICSTVDNDDFFQRNIFILFIFSVFMIIITLTNDYAARKVADPIGELEHSVKEIAMGNLEAKVRINGSSEVRSLARSVIRMRIRIQKLMSDMVREQELKRKSEMDSLQAQINPHFLYNTLDIITWLIEKDKKEQATEVVTALARLFRISISKGKNIISVHDEMEHIRNYLLIQSNRYKNKFQYEIKVDSDAEELSTIKLIVQPIVENAIYHAMEYMEDDGELEIHAYREADDLYIKVIDNGMGMTAEQAEALLKSPVKSKRGSGIGVYNVNERIKLYFGIRYGLEIVSEPDEGTEITLHMPAIPYSDAEALDL